MTSTLRPDELASLSEIERSKQRDRNLKKGAKTAIGIGTSAIGAGLSSRILPLLNEFVPYDLALKGINKISPKLGAFLNQGKEAGLDIQEGLNFIKDQFQSQEAPLQNVNQSVQNAPQSSAKDNRNIIQQYSDKLHSFLEKNLKKGLNPEQVIGLAQLFPEYKNIINKIENDHKMPFQSIVQNAYGNIFQSQPNQSKAALQSESQPTSQIGPGQQALLAMLKKINQSLGG